MNAAKKKFTSDEVKIYSWGRAIHEICDNPFFQTYQNMLAEVISCLEKSLSETEPENAEVDFGVLMARRTGKIAGMKEFLKLTEQYKNFYVKNMDQIEED